MGDSACKAGCQHCCIDKEVKVRSGYLNTGIWWYYGLFGYVAASLSTILVFHIKSSIVSASHTFLLHSENAIRTVF